MKICAVVVLLFCLGAGPAWASENIVVFTLSSMPVVDADDRATVVYELDSPDRVLASLSQGLSSDPDEAYREVMRRLNAPDWRGRLDAVEHSFAGVSAAWSHNISKLPAILINDRYVIYGIRDVTVALNHYRDAVR